MGELHLRDGFTYERIPGTEGDVRIRIRDHHGANGIIREVTVPEMEWASVIASVAAGGETTESYQAARDFHMGRPRQFPETETIGPNYAGPADDRPLGERITHASNG
jgi:hypothetical protein